MRAFLPLARIVALWLVALGAPRSAAQPPFVATQAATQIAGATATLNGAVNPNGTDTTAWFEWGTTPGYGHSTTPIDAGSGTSPVAWNSIISGLTPGVAYHCRAMASSGAGMDKGIDVVFEAPAVTLNGANPLTNCQAPLVDPGITATGSPLAISVDYFEVLALKADGSVAGWSGSIYQGPIAVPAGLDGVTAIAAGPLFGLALKADGTVLGWGDDTYGEADVPPGLNNVVAIAAGTANALALKSDGTIAAWGDNTYGETTVPAGLNNVKAIAAGDGYGLALKADGTVLGWGWSGTYAPRIPTGLNNVAAIAAGFSHSLALKNDGTVVAWGGNAYGETQVPSGLTDVIAIAAGYEVSLALKRDGTVVGWGDTTVPSGLNNVAAIATGDSLSLALKTDGTMVSWNHYGEAISVPSLNTLTDNLAVSGAVNTSAPGTYTLTYTVTNGIGGTGTATRTVIVESPVLPSVTTQPPMTVAGTTAALNGTVNPNGFARTAWFEWGIPLDYQHSTPVTDMGSGGAVVSLSAGVGGLTPGVLYHYRTVATTCAGLVKGQEKLLETPLISLIGGNPMTVECHTPFFDQVVVSDPPLAIAAGGLSSLALKSDGTAEGWGGLTAPAGLNNVVAIAAGYWHSLALKADGTVVAWGDNTDGATSIPASLNNVVAVAGGDGFSLALKSDGTVVGWGSFGQGANIPAGLNNVAAIAAGYAHSLALKNDGTVVAWGLDWDGQTDVPPGLTDVVAIAAGFYDSLALKRDGTVVGWGNSFNPDWHVPAGLNNVVALADGGSSDLALKSDGTVVGWGDNGKGQTSIPAGLNGVVAIAAGFYHSLALKNDGTVVSWGEQTSVPADLSALAGALTTSGTVNPDVLGTYTLNYTATNFPGGSSSATRTVLVVHALPPVFHAANNKTIECGTAWTFDPPTAVDTCNSAGLPVAIVGTVTNRTCPQVITRTWQATDTAGNSATTNQTVTIVDTTPPVITLLGDNPLTHQLGTPFIDPGATAWDICAGDLTSTVEPYKDVDPNTAGTYFHIYEVSDPCGNVSFKQRTVRVAIIPPSVTTQPAAPVAGTTATLNGIVNPNGRPTTAWFEWGPAMPSANTTPPIALGNGTAPVSISAALSGLTPGALYLCRAVATNGTVPVNGSARLLTLPAILRNGPDPLTNECHATFVDPGATVVTLPVAIDARFANSLALRSDGSVAAWGYGNSGATDIPAGLGSVTAIAAGSYFSLALKTDGTVVGWGSVPTIPAGLNSVVAIAAGDSHGLALKSDNTVVALGGDSYYGTQKVPTGLNNVNAISAGYNFSLALKANGTIAAWGDDQYGETDVPAGLTGVVAISAGFFHSLALKNDGTVIAWGYNYDGRTSVPMNLSNVLAVAAGGDHSLALRSDGTVVAWGGNSSGERNVPTALNNVVAIAAGYEFSLALRSDGSVVGWGNNQQSQITIPANLTVLSHNLTVNGTIDANTPGTYALTYTTTNILGGSAIVGRTVVVADTTPPALSCGLNKSVECGAVWDFDPPTATDACSGTNVTITVLSSTTNGNCPKVITRTWQATDASGNQSIPCSQTVTVVDTTPPVLTCSSNKTVQGSGCPGVTTQSAFSLLHSFALTSHDGQNPISGLTQASDGALYGTTEYGGDNGLGTIFKVNPDGSGYAIMHSFSSTGGDGRNPEGGLLLGKDGAIYGTTANGGAGTAGTVFKIAPDGSGYTVLRRFSGADGDAPEAGLLQGNDGFLYGVTVFGGSSFAGTVFRMDADGNNFTVLKNFPGGNEANPEDSTLVQGSDGTLYGTTGPRSGANGVVFKLAPDGSGYAVLKTFAGSDGQEPDAGLLLASDGELYGTTRFGGSYGLGTVFRLGTDGSSFTVLRSFSGADGSGPQAGLAEGCDGALYGTAGGGSAGGGVVFKLNKDGSAFGAVRNFSGSDTSGTGPGGPVVFGSDGALYGAAAGGGSGGAGTVFKMQSPSPWSFDPPTAADACCGTNVTIAILSTVTNTSNCMLVMTRTWQAADCCGNTSVCSQTLAGPDNTLPVVAFFPTNILLCATYGCAAMPDATSQVIASAPSGIAGISQSIPPGQVLCSNTPVVFTVTNACGNIAFRAGLALVQPCCISPPPGMVLWLAFDETAGATCLNSMGGNNGLRYQGASIATSANGPVRVAGEFAGNCLSFDGQNARVVVSNYPAINFGESDFSADAWLKWSGTNGFLVLAGKALLSAGPDNAGFAWYLSDGHPGLRLITSYLSDYGSSATLTPNRWTHLVVTVHRLADTAGQIAFYLDGVLTDTLPTAQAGTISTPPNTALLVGSSFSGSLDELELFSRALSADEVASLYQAQTSGKCRSYCSVPRAAAVCSNSVTVTALVCNYSGRPLDFLVGFRTLSVVEAGLSDSIDWDPLPGSPPPSYFSYNPAVVHVLPNQCAPVAVTITRPPALSQFVLFGPQKIASYEMAILDTISGERFSSLGTLHDGWFDCPALAVNPGVWTNIAYMTNVVAHGASPNNLVFTLSNPTNVPLVLNPRFVVFDEQMSLDTNFVSLNGMPPAIPATNQIALSSFGSADVGVTFNFTTPQPAKSFYLVLLADIGERGGYVPIASMTLRNVVPPTVGPLLDIASSNGQSVVSWDLVNTDFLLESTFDLSGTNWIPAALPVVELPEARQGATLPATNRVQIFRLRQ
ncbi:MAG TPA: choice-of-anchor tandem repeat GloVer-containing protein [Candidatus Binatia bacterium]|nr:choice-of-anchor tandem repeat GloVer-containing protein [Candidatus Binatia bacterium]